MRRAFALSRIRYDYVLAAAEHRSPRVAKQCLEEPMQETLGVRIRGAPAQPSGATSFYLDAFLNDEGREE